MIASDVLDHLLVALGGWLVGVILGGVLGALLAFGVRSRLAASSNLRRLTILLPWRTVVMTTLLVVCTPVSILLVGLGPAAGMLDNALVMLLLALPFTASVLFEHWFSSPVTVRLIAGGRTLATASFVVTTLVGYFDGVGIGWIMAGSLMRLHFDTFLQEWLVLAILVLITDLLVGLIQFVVSRSVDKKQMPRSVTQQSQPTG